MHILLLFNLATILLRPTFNSCGIYEEGVQGSTVSWCEAGSDKWSVVENFPGSLTGLKEDTAYKVRIERKSLPEINAEFRTWKSDVPVARTIEIDPATFKAPFKVNQKGSEDGWIRITAKGGKLHNPTDKPTFMVDGAEYVLIEDMVLTGAADSKNVIFVQNSTAVRIRNCDISGWGTKDYKQSFIGKYGAERYKPGDGRYLDRNGKTVNYEGAIHITKGADMTVVERCYIHDPLSRSVSWYYCHPAGPQAVVASFAGHSTVLRWNDFVGSDERRWNDAVEGPGNFDTEGGLNRDADVCGNFMIFANDDCIELDGGQQNIRCFGNRFEGALCGVSVQGCMVGPCFVFNNLFSGMVEEFDFSGQTIKTGGGKHGEDSQCYLFNNILWGRGSGIAGRENLNSHIFGNKLYNGQKVSANGNAAEKTDMHDNSEGLELDESALPVNYPERPLGFTLSRARITVGHSRKPVTVDIKGELPKGSRICKPMAMDWLKPELKGNKIVIKFDDSKMHNRREYRGAFIVRTPDGLSRPVSVYASSDFVPPFKAERKGDIAIYADGFKLSPKGTAKATFTVPKAGNYWVMIHGSSKDKKQKVSVKMDGKELGTSYVQMYDYPTWAMLCPGDQCKPIGTMVYNFDLKAGKHEFEIKHTRGSDSFDGLVITDNPKAFEPR